MPAGRPRKELDGEQVYKLARIGCTQADIADVFNVSVSTISRNYATDYSRAQGEFKTSLKRAQFLRAVKDRSDSMLIHLGKHYLGQAEKSAGDHDDGDPTTRTRGITIPATDPRFEARED